MRRIVCVWLPDWSVDVIRRHKRLPDATIVLLVAGGLEDEVSQCCENARRLGITPGISIAHARSLVGDGGHRYVVEVWDQAQDDIALIGLARWAKRYSPRVAVDQGASWGEGLILDVTGCTHLFGGASAMVVDIATALERFGLRALVGCAGTIGCAWAAARCDLQQCVESGDERSFLGECPVECLRLEPSCVESLHEVGLYEVGRLWNIPRAELAGRFGLNIVRRLDQALGVVDEVVSYLDEETLPCISHRFSSPVACLEVIGCVVRDLCQELSCVLRARDRGVVRLLLLCIGAENLECRRELCVSQPVCDGEHWWLLLRLELEKLQSDGVGGFSGGSFGGFEEIVLEVLSWESMVYEQGMLLETEVLAGVSDIGGKLFVGEVGLLVDRLRSRVGDDCVWSMKSVATHLPEDVSWFDSAGSIDIEDGAAGVGLFRPSVVLTSPELLEVLEFSDGGIPCHWRWRGVEGRCVLSDGPEVISGPWWRDCDDQRGRFYFRVQEASGCWLWMFWSRLSGCDLWYVHGWWA